MRMLKQKSLAHLPDSQYQTGFSLLEVLVALLVLSIGLLGLAALQTIGFKFNHQSYERTQAVFQAYDIIDRIRANPAARGNPAVPSKYDNVSGSTAFLGGTPCVDTTVCDATALSNYDLQTWKQAVKTVLASGQGAVCKGTIDSSLNCTTAAGNVYRVAITWKEHDVSMRVDVEAEI